jgi:predicted MFS family arabinose efflux permease
MQTFGFGADTLGWVIALFYVMGFIMAFPTTAFINKLGIKGAVAIAVAGGVIGSLLGALFSDNLPIFMISRIFEGMGFGVLGVAGSSAIAPWFAPEKRSVPLAIWSMWVAICMCLCPILYGWVVDTVGLSWTSIWWGTAVYDVIALVLFFALYKAPAQPFESEEEKAEKNRGKAVFSRAYKSKMLWGLALIFLFDEAAFMAINGFLTTYLTEQLATSLVFATGISSLFGFAGAIFPPISGAICQKFNNHRWILLFSLICGVAYTAVVFTLQNPSLYYGVAILAGIVGGWVPGIIWQFTPNTVEPDDIPAANSLVAFTQNLGMFIGAIAMGSAISGFGWSTGSFVALVPCYILCLIVYFVTGLNKTMKL